MRDPDRLTTSLYIHQNNILFFLPYASLRSLQETSQDCGVIVSRALNTRRQPETWREAILIRSLWDAIEKSDKSRSSTVKKSLFSFLASLSSVITTGIGFAGWKSLQSEKFASLFGVWTQANITLNNISDSCANYIQHFKDCTVLHGCEYVACPQLDSTEASDCKQAYNNIFEFCHESKIAPTLGFLLAFGLPAIATIVFFIKMVNSVTQHSMIPVRSLPRSFIQSLQTLSIPIDDNTSAAMLKPHLKERYRFLAGLHSQDDKPSPEESYLNIPEDENSGYIPLPGF